MKKNLLAIGLGLLISALLVLAALPLGLGQVFLQHSLAVRYWTNLVQDVDHRPKPGSEPGLNSDNIRAWREADSIRPGDFNVIFLGDSFVFGYFLDVHETPAALLEKRLREYYGTDRINVWNFGWVSSSPILEGRMLKDMGARYHPDLVLLNLDMTDFKDDYVYRRLLQRDGIYRYAQDYPRLFFHVKELVAHLPDGGKLHQRWFGYPPDSNYFVTRQPLEQSRLYFDTVKDSLDQVYRYSHDTLGVPFAVFMPPRHWQYTDREAVTNWEQHHYDVLGPHALEPFRYFDGVRASLPYPFIPLLDDFRQAREFPLCFPHDSHWNPAGARFAAEAYFRHCLAAGCFRALDERFGKTPPAQGAVAPGADLP